MPTIDSLDIQVSAQVNQANDSLKALSEKLEKVASSLSKIGTHGLATMGHGVKSLSRGMEDLNKVDSKKIKDITKKIESISNLKADNIVNISTGLKNFSTVCKEMNDTSFDSSGLKEFVSQVQKLGKVDVAKLSTSMNAVDKIVESISKLSTITFDGKNIKSLVSTISKLSDIDMSKLENTDFTKISDSINQLANSFVDTPKIQQSLISMTNAISNLAKNATNIPIATSSLGSFGNALKNLVLDVSTVPNLSSEIVGFTQAIGSLAKAGSKTSETASNLGYLATELKKFMQEMSRAPRVSQNVIDMTNALANLARTGSSSGKAVTSLGKSLNFYSTYAKKAVSPTISLTRSFTSLMQRMVSVVSVFAALKKSIDIASDLIEVQNVVDVTFGKYANLVEKISETSIIDFGMSELTTKQISSKFQAMGTAMGFAQGKMANMSIELIKLAGDMSSFYNVSQKDIAKSLEAVFTGETEPLRRYGLDLTQATLQSWALKQGIDANVQSMSQMEKTMLRYQYVMANTGAAQGDFIRTQDTWANQVRILRQNIEQLGAIVGGSLINAFKPLVKALNVVIGKFTEFAIVISNSLGKIFGWKFESSGGGITSEIAGELEQGANSANGLASSLGDAADNAKKVKQQLQGFDELNVLTSDSSSSSVGSASDGTGSGIGSGNTAYGGSSNGQWTKVDSIFKDYESELDTLYKLGEYIAESLKNTLESIDWQKVYEGASNFGSGFASFLNGIFNNDTDLLGSVGKTIANGLNTAIYTALSFGQTFDFEAFGKSISSGINNYFLNLDTKSLAKSINTWIKGGLSATATFIKNTDFELIATKIADLFKNLDVVGIISSLGKVLWEAIKAAFEFVKTLFSEAPLETALITAFGILKFTTLGEKISGFIASAIAGKLGIEIGENKNIASVLIEGLKKVTDIIKTSDIKGKLAVFAGKIWTGLGNAVSAVSRGASSLLQTMLTGISTAVSSIATSAGSLIAKIGSSIVGKIFIGVAIAFAAIKLLQWLYENTPFGAWVDNVTEYFSELFSKAIGKVKNVGEEITSVIKSAWENAEKYWNSVKDTLASIKVPSMGDVKKVVSDKWEVAKEWWNEKKTKLDKITTTMESVKSKVSSKWSEAKTWWKTKTNLSKVTVKFMDFKTALSEAWDTAKKWWNESKPKLSDITAKIKMPHLKVTWDTSSFAAQALQKLGLKGFPNFSVSYYATGGFPEDGWFRANHGEIMGKFDNGKSVVANNMQITEGISSAVQRGNQQMISVMQQELNEVKRQNEILSDILQKETGISSKELFSSVRDSAREYAARTGKLAFS